MIKVKDFMTTKTDGEIFLQALFKSIKTLPLIFLLNIIFLIIITTLEGIYNYMFVYKLNNDFITSLSAFNFTFLKLIFLIFLVPFQLYNRHKPSHASSLQFKPFIKRTAWPIALDSLKALGIALIYLVISFVLFIVLLVSVNYIEKALGVTYFSSYFASLATNPAPNLLDPRYIITLITLLVLFSPFIVRSIQFHFIPFVIFFNQEYIKNKVSSLKLSIQVSQGITILLIPVMIILFASLEILFNLIKGGISPSLTLISLLSFVGDSLIRSLSVLFLSAVLFFLYIAKDPSYNATSEK